MKRGFVATLAVLLISLTIHAAPRTETLKLCVSIHCHACEELIIDNLAFERGIRDIKIDLDNRTVEVKYNKRRTNLDNIRASLERLGYEVWAIVEESDDNVASKDSEKCCGVCVGECTGKCTAKGKECCKSKNAKENTEGSQTTQATEATQSNCGSHSKGHNCSGKH